MDRGQRNPAAESGEPRRRLLALVRAEAFAPYVQRKGERLVLGVGDDRWFSQNLNCRVACPVHTDVPRYIALVASGDYAAACAVNEEANLFPDILGRVCHRPCESACRRGLLDGPVAICHLKRFAADSLPQATDRGQGLERKRNGKRVAIVGSGPAGLAAAVALAGRGHGVTIYEALERPGGMLAVGIPPYRLPRRLVQQAVERVERLGVEIRLGMRVGEDVRLSELMAEHDAVLLAAGAHAPLRLKVPGEDAAQVVYGLPFLRQVNCGWNGEEGTGPLQIEGKRVLVVGGGHTAIDCARSSFRLGASDVEIMCLETRETMPADPHEVAQAEAEGIEIHPALAVSRILTEGGRVTGIACLNVTSLSFTPDGELTVETEPRPERVLPADVVVVAIGQRPALEPLFESGALEGTSRRTVAVNLETLATGQPGLFAAGDCVTGPLNVVDAVAGGRRAAVTIDRYLRGGSGETEAPSAPLSAADPTGESPLRRPGQAAGEETPRHPIPTLGLEQRSDLHREVELGYTEEQARQEARRCYQCENNVFVHAERCTLCNKCVEVCPEHCLEIIAFDRVRNGDELPALERAKAWLDGGAIFIDETLCTRCSKCVEVCPSQCMRWEFVPASAVLG